MFVYRIYDVAHEIKLKEAQKLLTLGQNLQKLSLQRDLHRTIVFRDAPLRFNLEGQENFSFTLSDQKIDLSAKIEAKMWDYGVLSICFKFPLESLSWQHLVELGAKLDNNPQIDELAKRRRDEIVKEIKPALVGGFSSSIEEDYVTYIIEEALIGSDERSLKCPLEMLYGANIAELLLFEPKKKLSESTRKSIESSFMQYAETDLLVFDWNSSLIVDFAEDKEYRDYADLLEFSLTQLLELRVYDQLLDEKLDELYNSMEKGEYKRVTNFYSALSEEASELYIEFNDFFDKIDNSLKTIGDVHLAKVLKGADKKFGFNELKNTMYRKMETLANICKLLQDKVDSQAQEQNTKISHRLELTIIILILVEVIPLVWSWIPKIKDYLSTWFS